MKATSNAINIWEYTFPHNTQPSHTILFVSVVSMGEKNKISTEQYGFYTGFKP